MPTGDRNAQQRREVDELLFGGHRMSWTPTSRGTSAHSARRPFKIGGAPVVDRRVLHLIKMWLDAPVEETDERPEETHDRTARKRGIPQGSPLSPLLSNLYMRRFVLGWKKLGLEEALALGSSPMPMIW